MVVIEVGPERKIYHLHEAFLTYYSEYFEKALQGDWKETQDGVIQLDDVDPGVFNLFMEYVYSEKLLGSSGDWHKLIESDPMERNIDLALVKAYVLGDRFLAPQFRMAIINHFVNRKPQYYSDKTEPAESYDIVKCAYANIPLDRPILQFLADEYCEHWDGK